MLAAQCLQLQNLCQWWIAGGSVRENKRNLVNKEVQSLDVIKSNSSLCEICSIIWWSKDFYLSPNDAIVSVVWLKKQRMISGLRK